jgi:Zn finger protein HypA/HybF involved in hydrogenase expression
MADEIKITEDGRLLCPQCSNNALQAMQDEEVELQYVVLHHRKDISKARFDQSSDLLVLIGNPVDGDTMEVFDEFLRCPRCDSRFDIPWAEDGDQQQDAVEYEGDFLREIKPDVPPHVCPACGGTSIKLDEDYILSKDVLRTNNDSVLIVNDDGKIFWDCGDNARMNCTDCGAQWSPPEYEVE